MIERIKDYSEVGKNGLSLLRDATILLLLIAFLAWPSLFANRMDKANIKVFKAAGFEIQTMETARQKGVVAVNEVESAQLATRKLIDDLKNAGARNPSLKPQLEPVLQVLARNEETVAQAGETIRSAAASQQTALAEAAPAKATLTGWVSSNYLDLRSKAVPGRTATVDGPRPLNVRSEAGSQSSTLGVLAPGTTVRVTEGPQANVWVRVTTEL